MSKVLDIPEGGYGKTRDGRKVGPLFHDRFLSMNEMFYRGTEELPDGWYCDGFVIRDGKERPDDLIAEWTDGPVRTVTRREVVPGVYDHVSVKLVHGRSDALSVCLPVATLTSDQLKAAAAVLLELAGALNVG